MRSEAAHRVGRRDVHAVWDGRRLGMGKVVAAHAGGVVESGVSKFREPPMGNKGREEGFPIQQFFKVVIVCPEELLADVWWGSTGSDRRNRSETTGCRPSGMSSLPICKPFQGCDVRMMSVGSEISETCGCTPCRSIVVVDTTTIPSVSDCVEGLVGGLGWAVGVTRISREERMEKTNRVKRKPIGYHQRKDAALVGFQMKSDTKDVSSGVDVAGGTCNQDESLLMKKKSDPYLAM
jgi:hypothetical protein